MNPQNSAHADSSLRPIPDVYQDGMNVASLLRHWRQAQPDAPAIIRAAPHGTANKNHSDSTTFRELDQRVDLYGHAFRSAGIEQGDRVGLFVTDGLDFVSLVYAFQRIGAVPVLIDPGMGLQNLLACIEEQALKAFVGIAKAQMLRLIFRRAFRKVQLSILVGSGYFPGAIALETLTRGVPDQDKTKECAEYRSNKDDPATIVYTSGSTGIPKGVVYTHRMMGGQVNGVAEVGGFSPKEVHLACFPGFALYAAGIGMTTVFPVMNFTKPGKVNPQNLLAAMEAHDVESAFGSPALWERFSKHAEEHDLHMPRIRAFFASGAAVQPALLSRIVPRIPNGDFFTPYGATESLPVAYLGGREILESTARKTAMGSGTCVGRLAEGMDAQIIKITDEPIPELDSAELLPRDTIGEIIVRGPVVTELYDQRPKHTALSKIRNPDGTVWHRMGDVGYLDGDGLLWFCGRKSHRVETTDGTMFSVPCEAIYENDSRVFRAALTWVGERPTQTPVMCIELVEGAKADQSLLEDLEKLGRASDITNQIQHLLIHPQFPVDRRHNAKIEREKLAKWATNKLK
jgi:olefin beta-lactone synthetase